MVARIVVVDDDLNPLVMLENHGVSVLAIDLRVGGKVARGQSSVQGRHLGHNIGDIIEGGLVAVVIQDVEGGVQGEDLIRSRSSLGNKRDKCGIIELLPLRVLCGGKRSSWVVDNGSSNVQLQCWRHDIKHGGIHVSAEHIIGRGVILGSDQDGIALSSSDIEAGDLGSLNVDTIDLNDLHLMSVNVDVEHSERRHVDDAETVGLAGSELELGILLMVDQSRLWDRFGTARVEDGQVPVQHLLVLSVIPVFKRTSGSKTSVRTYSIEPMCGVDNRVIKQTYQQVRQRARHQTCRDRWGYG